MPSSAAPANFTSDSDISLQSLKRLALSSFDWSGTNDDALLTELQKLSAWLLDSFQGSEGQLGQLTKTLQSTQAQLKNCEAAFERLAEGRPVVQAS